MKIFLSAAQGTGKSSIVKNFPAEKYGLDRRDSFSKRFLSKNNSNIQLDINSQEYLDFQHKIFLYCANIYINENNFISSRGLADAEAYTQCAWIESKNFYIRESLSAISTMIDDYTDILKREKDVYTFYIPIEFDINQSNNELRVVDKDYQRKVDYKIKSYLVDNGVKYHTLTGTVEDRIKQIEDVINENKP